MSLVVRYPALLNLLFFFSQGDHQRHQPGSDSSQHQSLYPHDSTGIRVYAPTLGPTQGKSTYTPYIPIWAHAVRHVHFAMLHFSGSEAQ